MNNQTKPSDLINDEIRDLQGTQSRLALVLWELMKQFAVQEIRHQIAKGN